MQQQEEGMKYYEVMFDNGKDKEYSMACRGIKIPSAEEATTFFAEDVAKFGKIYEVREISYNEMEGSFDLENIDNWPIFK